MKTNREQQKESVRMRIQKILVSVLGAALMTAGVSGVAMAESNPALGMPPLTAWVWSGSGIVFDYSGSFVQFGFSALPSTSVLASWNTNRIDNPAPLLWYAQHVSPTWAGTAFAGKYTSALIAKMNAEDFAPSMVGGTNAAGITAGSPPVTSSPPPPAPKSSPAPTPPVSKTPVSQSPPVSHSTAPVVAHSTAPVKTSTPPSSTTKTTPSATRSTPVVTHSATPHTSSTSITSTPPSSTPSPVQPPHQRTITYPRYRKVLAADSATHHPASHRSSPTWPWIIGGVIVVGAGTVWWRLRQNA